MADAVLVRKGGVPSYLIDTIFFENGNQNTALTGGYSWSYQQSASTHNVTYPSNVYARLECIGSGGTATAIWTKWYTLNAVKIPDRHNKMEIFCYVEDRQSWGIDNAGWVSMFLGTTQGSNNVMNYDLGSLIGYDDGVYFKFIVDITSISSRNVYFSLYIGGGQSGIVKMNVYKVRTYKE